MKILTEKNKVDYEDEEEETCSRNASGVCGMVQWEAHPSCIGIQNAKDCLFGKCVTWFRNCRLISELYVLATEKVAKMSKWGYKIKGIMQVFLFIRFKNNLYSPEV